MTTNTTRTPDCAEPPLGDLAPDEQHYWYPTDVDDPAAPELRAAPGGTPDV